MLTRLIRFFLNVGLFQVIETTRTLYHKRKIALLRQGLKKSGSNVRLPLSTHFRHPEFISIGDNFSALGNIRIEAWTSYEGVQFSPEIVIGNNVIFNTDIHIGCIDRIEIGNNVLLASRIFITDHFHGDTTKEAIALPPALRPLISKGPVSIGDNVWIGEGVAIMPGVSVGANSIIGANSVVTKSLPANSVAAGVPARIIKLMS